MSVRAAGNVLSAATKSLWRKWDEARQEWRDAKAERGTAVRPADIICRPHSHIVYGSPNAAVPLVSRSHTYFQSGLPVAMTPP